jgi:cell wall-associated NlpC family hydrolase
VPGLALDPRLNAFRDDLADATLKGMVEATRYAAGEPYEVTDPVIALQAAPRSDAKRLTELLMGERVSVFETTTEGWAWLQSARDGYVGYAPLSGLSRELTNPTHRVAVPATFLYVAPDVKAVPEQSLPMNAAVEIAAEDGKFARTVRGSFVYAPHLRPLASIEDDFVSVAEQFLNVPYLWGGKTQRGLDCSGLIQTAMHAAGIECPRDTDLQERKLGSPVNDYGSLRRGDLVFWDGHVGIMVDGERILHANGHHMRVALERAREAMSRIAASYGDVTSIKRRP